MLFQDDNGYLFSFERMKMEEIFHKVEEEWIAKTIGTPPSPSGEASWSTPQLQDNAFSSEEYDADDEVEKLDLDYK